MFSLKAPRFATNRKVLAEAGESIERFIGSGIAELGDKLGADRVAVRADQEVRPGRLRGVPRSCCRHAVDGRALRHVLDVRHDSFCDPEYLALARRHGVATVFADSDDYPSFADPTADFVYARLMRTRRR